MTAKDTFNTAIDKIQVVKNDIQTSYETAKDSAPDGTSELSVAVTTAQEKLGEAIAAAKNAYDAAGGADGISQTVASKTGEFAAVAKSTLDKATASKTAATAKDFVDKAAATKTALTIKEQAEKFVLTVRDSYTKSLNTPASTPASTEDTASAN